jgi:hypothetical protein
MSTARNYAFNRRSNVPFGRKGMIAAIQIEWKKFRGDLRFDKEELRESRLDWITEVLGLDRRCESMTELTDRQIAAVLDEIRKLVNPPRVSEKTVVAKVVTTPGGSAEIIHLSGEAQLYAIGKLLDFIGWTDFQKASFLKKRFRTTTERMLTHAQCNAFMMHLLSIAAHKDLKRILGTDVKISRKMKSEHIPLLKRTLGIDQRR